MVGDLKNGRTVHSLAKLLCLYDVTLRYVSPAALSMPESIKEYVRKKGIHQVSDSCSCRNDSVLRRVSIVGKNTLKSVVLMLGESYHKWQTKLRKTRSEVCFGDRYEQKMLCRSRKTCRSHVFQYHFPRLQCDSEFDWKY